MCDRRIVAWVPAGWRGSSASWALLVGFGITALAAPPAARPAALSDRLLGRPLWRTPLEQGELPYGRPAADRQRVFVVLEDGVRAYDGATGRELWRAPHQEFLPRTPVLAGALVITAEAVVTARERDTGRVRWRFVPDANAALGQPASAGDAFYFGTASHRLYALRAHSGEELWQVDVGADSWLQGVVRGVSADRDTVFVALDQWRAENGHQTSGHVIALDRHTGVERWRFVVGEGEERRGASSPPAPAGRLVLVSDYPGNALYALDRRSGQLAWRFDGDPSLVGTFDPPRVHRGRIYWASGEHAHALELETGRLLWRASLRTGAEALVQCGPAVVVNSQGLTFLERRDGREQARLLDGAEEFAVGGLATVGRRLLAAGSRAVYALSCDRAPHVQK